MVGEAICGIRRECELELRLDRLTLCSLSRLRHTGLRFSDAFGLERARGGFDPTGANRPAASTCRTLSRNVPPIARRASRRLVKERTTTNPLRPKANMLGESLMRAGGFARLRRSGSGTRHKQIELSRQCLSKEMLMSPLSRNLLTSVIVLGLSAGVCSAKSRRWQRSNERRHVHK
jgi:hypothetical protein